MARKDTASWLLPDHCYYPSYVGQLKILNTSANPVTWAEAMASLVRRLALPTPRAARATAAPLRVQCFQSNAKGWGSWVFDIVVGGLFQEDGAFVSGSRSCYPDKRSVGTRKEFQLRTGSSRCPS